MAFDPTKPADGAPVIAVELRNQLNALNDALATTAVNPSGVSPFGSELSISDPPTQAEVQQLLSKLNELISALRR